MGVLRDETNIFSYESSGDDLENLDNDVREEVLANNLKHQRKPLNKNTMRLSNLQTDNGYQGSSRKTGVKRSRRGENLKYLLNLVEKEDDLELSMEVGEPSISAFAELFMEPEKMKVWKDFMNSSEEEQGRILQEKGRIAVNSKEKRTENRNDNKDLDNSWEEIPDNRAVHPAFTPEECYQRLDRNIRLFLKRRNIPVGILHGLEQDLISFFKDWPGSVYVSKLTSSFERMLLHAICQYLDLSSSSFDEGNCRRTHVENKFSSFTPPSVLLSSYLQRAATSWQHNSQPGNCV
ncbi:R3H domain-containing protein 4-like [Mizuhopecten yessoensis]|uniref:R3H domain-containing protein 4 n=1 Tax=Mizuhopecten yessoensis TaxID=6573 RepID=A0A210QEX1_MIZYE|nr:R3H domain-containing protein 4-like [Mizuhopecten yessoensis]OWF47278.1 R3H domain-containing protein 4 [Mizuhopecten yessoensis]